MDSTQNGTKHRCHVVAMPIPVEATSSADILISFIVTEEWLGFGQDLKPIGFINSDPKPTKRFPEKQTWGTWEELLLACAVHRYDTESWDSVSMEIQKRSSKLHYHLQRRFNQNQDPPTRSHYGSGSSGSF
uniref:Uncharacterized protein n=1 Tax=Fagus sylvatica TaxID=28930 RepID=A0A2N9FBB9_FAGSY